jgi:hypothetical protein
MHDRRRPPAANALPVALLAAAFLLAACGTRVSTLYERVLGSPSYAKTTKSYTRTKEVHDGLTRGSSSPPRGFPRLGPLVLRGILQHLLPRRGTEGESDRRMEGESERHVRFFVALFVPDERGNDLEKPGRCGACGWSARTRRISSRSTSGRRICDRRRSRAFSPTRGRGTAPTRWRSGRRRWKGPRPGPALRVSSSSSPASRAAPSSPGSSTRRPRLRSWTRCFLAGLPSATLATSTARCRSARRKPHLAPQAAREPPLRLRRKQGRRGALRAPREGAADGGAAQRSPRRNRWDPAYGGHSL